MVKHAIYLTGKLVYNRMRQNVGRRDFYAPSSQWLVLKTYRCTGSGVYTREKRVRSDATVGYSVGGGISRRS